MFVNQAHEYYVKQREEDMENIINYFYHLYEDDIDINDEEIQCAVFKKYDFEPSDEEARLIKEGIEARIR